MPKGQMTLHENDAGLSPYHRDFRPDCFAYLVTWRTAGIVKVGETWSPRRWRRFLSTGAEILLIAQTDTRTALDIEQSMGDYLRATSDLAFASKDDSYPHLGKAGGHMECYSADPDDALRQMREVIGALVQD